MHSESVLIEKLLKIEALYLGATTEGEKEAAQNARDKIQRKLEHYQKKERPIEWRLTTRSKFEKNLLRALLKRYGLRPYRYTRQKYTTVMVKATRGIINDVIWPEYQEMRKILLAHLDEVTEKIIKTAINSDDSAEEIREESPQVIYQQ